MIRLRHTDYLLWALFALTALIGFGFYHPAGNPDEGLWGYGRVFLNRPSAGQAFDAAIGTIMWLAALAPPAILVGWLAQAAVLVCGVRLTGRPRSDQAGDFADPPVDRSLSS
jgi:hypothetical protein